MAAVRSFAATPIRGPIVATAHRSVDVLNPARPVDDSTRIVASGRFARLIVAVKTGSCRMRSQWLKAQRELGLVAVAVQTVGDEGEHPFLTSFEVAGPPDGLEKLTAMAFVKDWHPVMGVSIGYRAVGSGAGE